MILVPFLVPYIYDETEKRKYQLPNYQSERIQSNADFVRKHKFPP